MSGNLFESLLSLHDGPIPEEDFFTEVIAWYLDKNPEVLFAWAREFLGLVKPYQRHSIETQVPFNRLEGHEIGSRPDMLVNLYMGDETDTIMIESKMGSREGNEQLLRYADHLSQSIIDAYGKYLVYITRDYDPKVAKNITGTESSVVFSQLRWNDFYCFLKKQPPSQLLNEILEFMRRHNMSEITKLTAATLTAISSTPDVYRFFEVVIHREVQDKFIEVFGKKPKSGFDRLKWNIYDLYLETNNWEYSIGFYMPEPLDGFPIMYASFTPLTNDSKIKNELVQAMKQIVSDTALSKLSWKGYSLDKITQDTYIEITCAFSEILSEENHVEAMKKRLLEFLDETERIINNYQSFNEMNK